MAVINPHTTRATGTVLTAAIYNTDHQNHITNANALNAGVVAVNTLFTTAAVRYDMAQIFTNVNKKQVRDNLGIFQYRYKRGFITKNNVSDLTNDIDFGPGECSSSDPLSPESMYLPTTLTKRLDAVWAVGNAAGMLDTGTITDITYHFYAIKRLDTGVVDIIASIATEKRAVVTMTIASPAVVTLTDHGFNVGASFKFETTGALPTGVVAGTQYFVIAAGFTVNSFQFSLTQGGAAINSSGTQSGVHTLQAGPVMPANYTHFRRIFSMIRTAGTILRYYQVSENKISYENPINTRNSAAALASSLLSFSVPKGIRLEPLIRINVILNTVSGVTTSFGSFAAGAMSIAVQTVAYNGASTFQVSVMQAGDFLTNYTQQIYAGVSLLSGTLAAHQIDTMGFIDNFLEN